MVKNFIHVLRTYLITFRYLKKNEIFIFQWLSLLFVFLFCMKLFYLFLFTLI